MLSNCSCYNVYNKNNEINIKSKGFKGFLMNKRTEILQMIMILILFLILNSNYFVKTTHKLTSCLSHSLGKTIIIINTNKSAFKKQHNANLIIII